MCSNTKKENIKKELENNDALELCAKQCGVIGDSTKLKICYLLRYYPELNVSTIAELVGTSVSNASHSLAKLKDAELVETRRDKQTIFYSLKKDAFDNIMKYLAGNMQS